MQYTMKMLFEWIAEPKCPEEFYQTSCDFLGLDDFLGAITGFCPNGKKIFWGYGDEQAIQTINPQSGFLTDKHKYLVYTYLPHISEFETEQMESLQEVTNYLKSSAGLKNQFVGDIVIIHNGKRLKFCVKDRNGKILHTIPNETEYTIEFF